MRHCGLCLCTYMLSIASNFFTVWKRIAALNRISACWENLIFSSWRRWCSLNGIISLPHSPASLKPLGKWYQSGGEREPSWVSATSWICVHIWWVAERDTLTWSAELLSPHPCTSTLCTTRTTTAHARLLHLLAFYTAVHLHGIQETTPVLKSKAFTEKTVRCKRECCYQLRLVIVLYSRQIG